jgi:hypothetical protein
VRPVRMLTIVGTCVGAALAMSAVGVTPALAGVKGIYEPFHACPFNNPEVSICVHAETAGGKEGGQFTVGSITIPLSKKITLQGGLTEAGYTGETELEGFFGPENGEETLAAPALKVPGGFVNRIAPQPWWPTALTESFESAKKNHELSATETLELAGTPELDPGHLLAAEGTAFELPMKVRVSSPWLTTLGGGTCHVGSNENPILVDLTSGASTGPFPYEYNTSQGKVGEIAFKDEFNYAEITHSTLVNSTYSVTTGAEGCGGEFESVVDHAISTAAGVPDASGQNTVILTGTQKVSVAERVKEVIG